MQSTPSPTFVAGEESWRHQLLCKPLGYRKPLCAAWYSTGHGSPGATRVRVSTWRCSVSSPKPSKVGARPPFGYSWYREGRSEEPPSPSCELLAEGKALSVHLSPSPLLG